MKIVKSTNWLLELFEMSDEDKAELKATGNNFRLDMLDSRCDVLIDGSKVLAVGGFTDTGVVWLLTSKEVKKLPLKKRKEFVKTLKDHIDNTLRENPDRHYYVNAIWEKNKSHIDFVKKFGGVFQQVFTNPKTGENFIPFKLYNKYYEGRYYV